MPVDSRIVKGWGMSASQSVPSTDRSAQSARAYGDIPPHDGGDHPNAAETIHDERRQRDRWGADRADLQTGTGANAGREPVAREWDGLTRNRREPPLTAVRDGTINTDHELRSLRTFRRQRSLFGLASPLVPAAQSLLSFRNFGRRAAAPRRESDALYKLKKVEKRRRPQTRRLRVETTLRTALPCDAIPQTPRQNKWFPADRQLDDSGRSAESRSRIAVVSSVAEFSKHPKFQRCKT